MSGAVERLAIPRVASGRLWGSAGAVLKDSIKFLRQQRQTHGDSFQFRLGTKRVFFFAHPDQVKHALLDCRETLVKSQTRESFGASALTSEGATWLRLRKGVQPFFTQSNLDAMSVTIDQLAAQAVAGLGRPGAEQIPVHEFFDHTIERILVALFFGTEAGEDLQSMVEKIYFLSDQVIKMTMLPAKPPRWFPFFRVPEFYTSLDDFYSLSDRLLETGNPPGTGCPFRTFLGALKGSDSSADEKRVQTLAFVLAGFETTVNGLFWTFLELLRNPVYLDRIRQEWLAGTGAAAAGYAAVERAFPWTRRCLLEGMRLHPPVWFRTRTVARDFDFQGYPLPKGSLVWISQAVTHRHPDFWSEPDRFHPERFGEESESEFKRHPFQYFPFSQGKNICQGRELAMAEMILLLSRLVGSVDFQVEARELASVQSVARVSLRPREDLAVRVSRASG